MSGCIGYENNKQGKRDYDALDAKSGTQKSGIQASKYYKSQNISAQPIIIYQQERSLTSACL